MCVCVCVCVCVCTIHMCVRHHHCYFFNVHSESGSWRETEVFICPVCGEGTSSPLILCGEYLSSLPLTLYTRAFARRRSVLGRFSVFSYMGERGGGRRCEKKNFQRQQPQVFT
ncbi:conserved hypothetical protein, unlikely [Trypanosoma brucei gambiense DAL972]|uniref:Uncharacterized protein n=1 Tax=Trypanosoma brucei gambiense (strain MHOM/CI/86/DAL972) TaxID=679716 RepID=C9ZYL5_TRYB9|nr:conserved hypothetical protein, unlikely [Trypanosoma brucei gambiense DAL972]CBH14514.1 conserved hypothetical protein, unlikely [Trypanosoma brucei gambiense DAL972]|eukprot:XP_011776780.1 conserved hypothetical protein, unlikely [Trypanosoma brucei gambiense DAL972]